VSMTEKPILFSAPMVRAILEGRKSQTRRIMKPQPDDDGHVTVGEIGTSLGVAYLRGDRGGQCLRVPCPYGFPGSRLWVRETCRAEELPSGLDGVRYLADNAFVPIANTSEASDAWLDLAWYGKRASPASPIKTVPAIHQPSWASRITLEVVGVRVERLGELSESDALHEGVASKAEFIELWKKINGKWEPEIWIWVLQFLKV
jgi:hypothetical protein